MEKKKKKGKNGKDKTILKDEEFLLFEQKPL